MNVIVIDNETLKIIIIYQGVVYSSINGEKPAKIFKLEHGRNVLHNSLAKTPEGCLIFGEYYGNNNQDPVNIYRINLSNFDWDIPYTFKSGEIRHVHSCLWDKYSQKIWIFTGDFQDECRVYETGTSFEDFEIIGAGSQQWRAVSAFFTTDFVYWIMDSPLETSCLIKFNRKTKTVESLQDFPGPVYYSIEFEDGGYMVATTHEPGPSVTDNSAHIFFSNDLENWEELVSFEHDGLSMKYLKYGIIGFATGYQTKNEFYFFCEAIKHMDGKSFKSRLA